MENEVSNKEEVAKAESNNNTPDQKNTGKTAKAVGEIVRFIAIAAILVIVVREFVVQPFIVKGDSMVPSFHNGEYLIIDELSYKFRDVERGEVIVFRYPKDPTQFFIKRVIGLPGETLEIKENKVTIRKTPSDQNIVLAEKYLQGRTLRSTSVTLGDDEYFVMGDNREASSDSRTWGTLPKHFIIGRAFVRLLPINEVGFFPADFSKDFSN